MKPAPEALLDRLGYYRRALFQDNQRLMADALGVSQSYVSKIFTRAQPPSHAFLGSLARHPLVSRDWLLSGEGVPLLPSTAGTLPGSTVILPGPPTEYADLLSAERYSVADNLERDTRYFLILQPASPLVRKFAPQFQPGDRLLMETARAYLDRLDVIDGQLCGVLARPGTQEYAMAQVYAKSGGLMAELYDGHLPGADSSLKGSTEGTPHKTGKIRRRILSKEAAKVTEERKKKEAAQREKSTEESEVRSQDIPQESEVRSQDILQQSEPRSEDTPGLKDTDWPKGWRQLDGLHQMVGLALRLERDTPLVVYGGGTEKVRVGSTVESYAKSEEQREQETAGGFGKGNSADEPGWGRERHFGREGGRASEDEESPNGIRIRLE